MAQETRAQKHERWKQTLKDMGAYEAHEKVAKPYANEKDKYQRWFNIGMDMGLYDDNGKGKFEREHPEWSRMPNKTAAQRSERWQEMMKIMQKEEALRQANHKRQVEEWKAAMNKAYLKAHPNTTAQSVSNDSTTSSKNSPVNNNSDTGAVHIQQQRESIQPNGWAQFEIQKLMYKRAQEDEKYLNSLTPEQIEAMMKRSQRAYRGKVVY